MTDLEEKLRQLQLDKWIAFGVYRELCELSCGKGDEAHRKLYDIGKNYMEKFAKLDREFTDLIKDKKDEK